MSTATIALFFSIFTFMTSPAPRKEAKAVKSQTTCSDHKFEKLMSINQKVIYPNYRLLLSNWQKIN